MASPFGRGAAAPVILALGLIALGALSAGVGFLSAPAPGAGQRLRAAGISPSLRQLPAGGEKAAGSSSSLAAASVGTLLVVAGVAAARRVQRRAIQDLKGTEISKDTIPRPEDLLESPKFPLYMGSTGGYMSKATRERHAITWTAKEPYIFEMPTGGNAIMNKGENLCYFRRKEQCICLGKVLRKMKIENYKIYRLRADGTVVFMHPADGVFPEKVNKGRVQVNGRPFTTCMNPQQAELKWTKYHMKSYEADPLTTLFVKARIEAFEDKDNVWVLPQPDEWVTEEEWPEYIEAYQKAWEAQNKDKEPKSL